MRKGIYFLLFVCLPVTCFANNYWQGPVGGIGGNYFQKIVASHERVCGIYIRHGSRIDAVQLNICDGSGNSYRSQRFGGSGGSESYFSVSANEYISGLKVYLGNRNGGERVFGLQFEKNKIGSSNSSTRVFSPFYGSVTTKKVISGGQTNIAQSYFDFAIPGVVGISGRADKELDAIGLVFSDAQRTNDPELFLHAAVGGNNGLYKDYFALTDGDICRFDVRHGALVDGLRFKKCTSDGGSQYSPWYGGAGGSISSFILQDGEQLVAIRGSLIARDGRVTLSSVYFVTDKRVSPIYGEVTAQEYRLDIPDGLSPYLLQVESKGEINALSVWSM